MKRTLTAVRRLFRNDDGQDLMEYGLIAVIVATGAILTMKTLGGEINAVLWAPIVSAL
jgi:Flp pilus assembly pilin Flp